MRPDALPSLAVQHDEQGENERQTVPERERVVRHAAKEYHRFLLQTDSDA